jgi:hypothetical protein
VFKNEGHVLFEWVLHHLGIGVGHIYLIDNNSRDMWATSNGNQAWLAHLVRLGKLTILQSVARQQKSYQVVYKYAARVWSDWVITLDLDEFLYTTNGADFALLLREKYDAETVWEIRMGWRMFGMSAHMLQPGSLTGANVMAIPGSGHGCEGCPLPEYRGIFNEYGGYKSIANTKFAISIEVHRHTFLCSEVVNKLSQRGRAKNKRRGGGCFLVDPGTDGPVDALRKWGTRVRHVHDDIRINHYRYQSWEFWLGVKEPRGSGTNKQRYAGGNRQPGGIEFEYGRLAPRFNARDTTLQSLTKDLRNATRCLNDANLIQTGVIDSSIYGNTRWNRLAASGERQWGNTLTMHANLDADCTLAATVTKSLATL